MLRKILGRLLGYERQIEDLNRQIENLSWDANWGMWTRLAFTQFAHVMPRAVRVVAFIDLEDIHGLNHRLGYTEVDRRINAMFSLPFRRSDLVARWYSGDEIAILFDTDREGAERKISDLYTAAQEQGLAFKHRLGQWEVGKETIEEVIGRLADELVTTEGTER